jgi:hypothetical protein
MPRKVDPDSARFALMRHQMSRPLEAGEARGVDVRQDNFARTVRPKSVRIYLALSSAGVTGSGQLSPVGPYVDDMN